MTLLNRDTKHQKEEQMIFDWETKYGNCFQPFGELLDEAKKDIRQIIRQTREEAKREALEECLEVLTPTFSGCACGLHGYKVLPDCDEEKHDLKQCADCALHSLSTAGNK